MSRYISVFVDSELTPEAFSHDLAAILGVHLQDVVGEEFIFYEFADDRRWFNVGNHTLENDDDLPFEEYRYQIEVGTHGIYDAEKREQVMLDFAREIYEKLKATHKYRLLLVDDVQIKLDEFVPAPQASS